jgi:hypothetical protein
VLLNRDRAVEDKKLQAPSTKSQINSNYRNSKFQTSDSSGGAETSFIQLKDSVNLQLDIIGYFCGYIGIQANREMEYCCTSYI